ncbi:MAG: uracil-DNA glycosylase [Elusimicrobiota bacterium]|nr:uracil-DNA glycosylase [Elusimicrobiota bacterium]
MNKNSLKQELIEKLERVKQYLKEEKFLENADIIFASKRYKNKTHTKSSDKNLEKLSSEVSKCKKCELYKYRINAVFGEGDVFAEVMFVGEGPGYDEDRQGRPFVGKAGQLLTKIIESIGLRRENVYITNIVKCHPMVNPELLNKRGNDRPPTEEEILSCLPYLITQIEIIAPKFIVTLGNVATQTILRRFNCLNSEETMNLRGSGITNLRGKFYQYKNLKILPTYHPAALLRNPRLKKYVWEDMKLLKANLEKVIQTK